MTDFYIGKIFTLDEYELAFAWLETQNNPYYTIEEIESKNGKRQFILVDITPTPEELEQAEKERIENLKMTRSDFFDGTIMAWGVNEKLLLPLIENMLMALPLDDKLKLKAINNFENAQNFYRKHDLFKMIVNIPLQLTDSIQVIITDEHLDKFFDEVNKGNKDTAWEYLPQPMAITQ